MEWCVPVAMALLHNKLTNNCSVRLPQIKMEDAD